MSQAAQRWMLKAESNLQIAIACCELGFFDSAANRGYYAVVHTQAALLVARGRHDLVRPYLDKEMLNAAFELIRSTDRRLADVENPYTSLRKARTTADYRPGHVSPDLAAELVGKLQRLVAAVKACLE